MTNRGEAHLELNAFRRKHDCALVISGDSLEVSAGASPGGSSQERGPFLRAWGGGGRALGRPTRLAAPNRSASSTTSTSSWSWRASARPWSAAAAPPPRRPRSCACCRNAPESSPAPSVGGHRAPSLPRAGPVFRKDVRALAPCSSHSPGYFTRVAMSSAPRLGSLFVTMIIFTISL